MDEENNSSPIDNLSTRAFVLLRKLVKAGKLSEAETHELVEIIKEMPATSFSTEVKAELKILNAKYDQMRWLIAILVAAGVLNFLANIFGWGAA